MVGLQRVPSSIYMLERKVERRVLNSDFFMLVRSLKLSSIIPPWETAYLPLMRSSTEKQNEDTVVRFS